MADIELQGEIKLNVTREQARRATKDAAEEAGKAVAKQTEDGFAKGVNKAVGTRIRSILGKFGQIINIQIPSGEGGLPAAPTAAAAGGGGRAGALGRFVAAVGKAGLVVGAVGAVVAGAALALKGVVTRLLRFGRSLAGSSALVAVSFAQLDIRMDLLKARIGNKLAPSIDLLTNSVARLFEQVGPKLVPKMAQLFVAISKVVDFVAAVAPGGRATPNQAALAGLSPLLALILILRANTDAVKANTDARKQLEIPPEQAGIVPGLFDLIIGGAPRRAPAAGGQPGFAANQPDVGARRFFQPPANAADEALSSLDRTLAKLRAGLRPSRRL